MTMAATASGKTTLQAGPQAVDAFDALASFEELRGSSPPMLALYDEIARVAATDATAFVVGESGSGKELVARALHRRSARADRAIVAVNCGAIPRQLLEAELFGHERGSFTGAHQQHAGYFERASGGTLFLDEVTEMPLDMQVKLLRVIETGSFHRVGGTTMVESDMRIIAATNRDVREAVTQGAFREDLLYRLAVFPIRVPPLRERGSDAVRLAQHFLAELAARSAKRPRLTPHACEIIARYPWPGNVRELRNAIQRAFILCEGDIDIPDPATARGRKPAIRADDLEVWIGTPLADAQRALVLATLDHLEGDKPATATALGISLKTLYNRLESYRAGGMPTTTARSGVGTSFPVERT